MAFKPIFLWHLSDKLFIESELEVATDEGDVEVVLEYVNMVYFINNNLAVHFGRFLPKFGSYRGKYMEGFLNRFPTDPVGFGDGGIGAMTETGLGLQGGADIGNLMINYDFYVSNGPNYFRAAAMRRMRPGNLIMKPMPRTTRIRLLAAGLGSSRFLMPALSWDFPFNMPVRPAIPVAAWKM